MMARLYVMLLAVGLIPVSTVCQEYIRYYHPILSPPLPESIKGERGTIRALVVGVSHYQDEGYLDLPYARRDAEAFAAYLKTPGGGSLSSENLELLTNETATLARFTDALNWMLTDSKAGDKIVVHCVGYGKFDHYGKDVRLLFYDSPPAPTDAGFFPLSKLTDLLQRATKRMGVRILLWVEFRAYPDSATLPASWSGSDTHSGMRTLRLGRLDSAETEGAPDTLSNGNSYSNTFLGGLLGLADDNHNEKVHGPEIQRYLRGRENEHPGGKTFASLSYPARDEWICNARETTRNTLTGQLSSPFSPLLYLEVQPLDKFMQTNADSMARRQYEDFILTIRLGRLMTPPERCAASLLDSLLSRPELSPVYKQLQRRMAVAYQDEAQQALNAYLRASVKELNRRRKNRDHYRLYPEYLQRTIDILGRNHFMRQLLEAKLLYFEGLTLRLDSQHNADTSLLPKALEKQLQAIELEPEAAFVYNEIGVLHFLMKQDAEAETYFNRALEYSPTWGIPQSNLSLTLLRQDRKEEAKDAGYKAIQLSNWNPNTFLNLGVVYKELGDYEGAAKLFRSALIIDPEFPDAHYNLACIQALTGQGEEAMASLRQAIYFGYDRPDEMTTDKDLASLQKTTAFQQLVAIHFPDFRR